MAISEYPEKIKVNLHRVSEGANPGRSEFNGGGTIKGVPDKSSEAVGKAAFGK